MPYHIPKGSDEIYYRIRGRSIILSISPGDILISSIIAELIRTHPKFNKIYRIRMSARTFRSFLRWRDEIIKDIEDISVAKPRNYFISRMKPRGTLYDGKFSLTNAGKSFLDIILIPGISIIPAKASAISIRTTEDDEVIICRNIEPEFILRLVNNVTGGLRITQVT